VIFLLFDRAVDSCVYKISRRKREAEPDPAEDSDQETADSLHESDNTMSESARKIGKNQKIFNDAMFVALKFSFHTLTNVVCFSASASKEKEKLKAPKLESLSENTVYLEDIAPQHLKSPYACFFILLTRLH
jgi:hypothetical protein